MRPPELSPMKAEELPSPAIGLGGKPDPMASGRPDVRPAP